MLRVIRIGWLSLGKNQEEMNDLYNQAMNSYDLMSEHHRNQNIAMLGLAGLYTYNIIEFRWKINGKWWKKR